MFTIRPFNPTEAEYHAIIAINQAVWPDYPEDITEWQHADRSRDPNYVYQRLVVEQAGEIIAVGGYGETPGSYRPGKYFLDIMVLPDYRRQGIATAVYEHILKALADKNLTLLIADTREDQPAGLMMLKKYGFQQVMREPRSHLDVSIFDWSKFSMVPEKVAARNIQIYSVAELQVKDSDWLTKYWELRWVIAQDIPHSDPPTKLPLEQFEKRLQSPSFRAEARFVAVDNQAGDMPYVGVSELSVSPADQERFYTNITGVIRSHRRKGIATALKLKAIAYAQQNGAKLIETENEENNPMYQLNLDLGFKPQPAWLLFEKHF